MPAEWTLDELVGRMLDAVAEGLCKGAELAQISISGGETAQLKDVVKHFDIVGMAVGRVDIDKVIDGRAVREPHAAPDDPARENHFPARPHPSPRAAAESPSGRA